MAAFGCGTTDARSAPTDQSLLEREMRVTGAKWSFGPMALQKINKAFFRHHMFMLLGCRVEPTSSLEFEASRNRLTFNFRIVPSTGQWKTKSPVQDTGPL